MKYYLRTVTILFLIIALLVGCKQQPETVFSDSRNRKWVEDVVYLQTYLPKVHGDLFYEMEEEVFNDKIEMLKRDIPYLDDDTIQIRLKEIFTLAGDGHLMIVDFESKVQKVFELDTLYNIYIDKSMQNIYPIKTKWFEDELYVTEIDREYEKALGAKVTKIDGQPILEVADNINTLISHTNDQRLKFINPMYLIHPSVLAYFDLTHNGKCIFTFENHTGETFDIDLNVKTIEDVEFVSVLDNQHKPLYMSKKDFFWYEYLPTEKILYFKFNVYTSKESHLLNKWGNEYNNSIKDENGNHVTKFLIRDEPIKKLSYFEGFLDEMFKTIDEKDVEKFVIDLRDNNGGSYSLHNALLEKIMDENNSNQYGELFTIINKGSFSAPIRLCLNLQKETNSIFIGEPTGEAPYRGGGAAYMQLPNSQLFIFYSMERFIPLQKEVKYFNPDIQLEPTFEEFKRGEDPILDFIKSYKKN